MYTYRLDDAGEGFKWRSWRVSTVGNGSRKDLVSLSYVDKDLKLGDWTWVAKKEVSGGVEKCESFFFFFSAFFACCGQELTVLGVPWYVKTSRISTLLTEWELVTLDLRLITAKGPVNSNAPGGVEE